MSDDDNSSSNAGSEYDENEMHCCICLQTFDKDDSLAVEPLQFCKRCSNDSDKMFCPNCLDRLLATVRFDDDANANFDIDMDVEANTLEEAKSLVLITNLVLRNTQVGNWGQVQQNIIKWIDIRGVLFAHVFPSQRFCSVSSHDWSLLPRLCLARVFNIDYVASIGTISREEETSDFKLEQVDASVVQPLGKLHLSEPAPRTLPEEETLSDAMQEYIQQHSANDNETSALDLQQQMGIDVSARFRANDAFFDSDENDAQHTLDTKLSQITCPLCRANCNVIRYRQSLHEVHELSQSAGSGGDRAQSENTLLEAAQKEQKALYQVYDIFNEGTLLPCQCCVHALNQKCAKKVTERFTDFQKRCAVLLVSSLTAFSICLTNREALLISCVLFYTAILLVELRDSASVASSANMQVFRHCCVRSWSHAVEVLQYVLAPGRIFLQADNMSLYDGMLLVEHLAHNDAVQGIHGILLDLKPKNNAHRFLDLAIGVIYAQNSYFFSFFIFFIGIFQSLTLIFGIALGEFKLQWFFAQYGHMITKEEKHQRRLRTSKKNCKLAQRIFSLQSNGDDKMVHVDANRKQEFDKQLETERVMFERLLRRRLQPTESLVAAHQTTFAKLKLWFKCAAKTVTFLTKLSPAHGQLATWRLYDEPMRIYRNRPARLDVVTQKGSLGASSSIEISRMLLPLALFGCCCLSSTDSSLFQVHLWLSFADALIGVDILFLFIRVAFAVTLPLMWHCTDLGDRALQFERATVNSASAMCKKFVDFRQKQTCTGLVTSVQCHKLKKAAT